VSWLKPTYFGDPPLPDYAAPHVPPWPNIQPFERQQWLDEFRAMRQAIDRLTDAQLAAIAAGQRPRIRVKARSRRWRSDE
jgi:hypothetical protein